MKKIRMNCTATLDETFADFLLSRRAKGLAEKTLESDSSQWKAAAGAFYLCYSSLQAILRPDPVRVRFDPPIGADRPLPRFIPLRRDIFFFRSAAVNTASPHFPQRACR